jgi:hypothetical protein
VAEEQHLAFALYADTLYGGLAKQLDVVEFRFFVHLFLIIGSCVL